MSLSENKYLVFDCTRLFMRTVEDIFVRTSNDAPTGIDRVEMAYAHHLEAHYAHRTRYLVTLNGYPQIIPSAIMRKFLHATEAVWNDAPALHSVDAVSHVANFLNISSALLREGTEKDTRRNGRSVARKLWAANILLRSSIGQVRPRRIWAFNRGLRRSVYINVSHENLDNPHIARWLEQEGVSGSVFMVHDLIPITHPEFVKEKAPERHMRRIKTIGHNASYILANSKYTGDCLSSYLTQNHISCPPIRIAPLGIENIFTNPYSCSQNVPPYFVFVSTIEPRKNHIFLLQIWARLVEEMGAAAPRLVLVGRRGWENENAIDLLERAPHIRSHVIECANLPDSALTRLIVNARATLFPSYVEGYGLPVAESLALRTPVICSDIPVLREVAGKLAHLIDPLDGMGWLQAIKQYAQQNALQAQLMRSRLGSYRPQTWSNHMKVFDNVISTLFKMDLAA